MSLREQPYLPLYVKDFLTDEKLRRCKASTCGIYIFLMCILHKSETYGAITLKEREKTTNNQIQNFALVLLSQIGFSLHEVMDALDELVYYDVIQIEGDTLSQKRMVKDGETSKIRALAGARGGRPPKAKQKQNESKTQSKTKAKQKQNTAIANAIANGNEYGIETDIEIVSESERNLLEVKRTWNELGLSQIRTMGSSRKRAINARIKEYGIDTVLKVIKSVEENPFLQGKNDINFVADIDWIMKPEKFARVYEGFYKRMGQKQTAPSNPYLDALQRGDYDE